MKESEKVEEKINESGFNPVDSIKEACEELGIDWRAKDFDEKEMIAKF